MTVQALRNYEQRNLQQTKHTVRLELHAKDIDLAEVHDCFTIAEVLATEDLGFTGRGEGGRFAREGEGRRNEGSVTINASGGLKSKGHPLGATGTVRPLKYSNNYAIKQSLLDR